jgi:hypothetical protein
MNPLKKFGTFLWLMVCFIDSLVIGLIFISWYNSLKDYIDFNLLESLFVIFVLLVFSLVLSVPFLIYILIRDKLNIQKKSKIKEYSFILSLYCGILYLIFLIEMRSFIVGIEVIITYYISGIFTLNLYLRKRENYIT